MSIEHLESDRRLTRPVHEIGCLNTHSHPCSIYKNREQLKQQFVPYLRAGLALGDRCIYFVDENDESFVVDAMEESDFDLAPYIRSGQFQIVHTNTAHLSEGYFAEDKMLAYWNDAIDAAHRVGFNGLRAAVEMTWALSGKPGCQILAPYESRLTRLMHDKDASVICMYSRRKFAPEKIKAIIHAHPFVVTEDGTLLENPACPSPEKFEEGSVELDIQVILDNLELIRELKEAKRDIERRQSEDAAFRLLVAGVKDYAIFMLDPDGRVVTWNEGAQRIKGYTASEIIGQHFSKFYTEDALMRRHPEKELEIAKLKGRHEDEGPRVRKDGSIFWANVVITALFDRDKHVGFAKVTRDLTERRNAEQSRQRALERNIKMNEELQHLAYTISHELQQPISLISSYSKLLLSRYRDRLGEDADSFLEQIDKGAKMTARMVDDLWTYARVTKPGAAKADVSLGALLQQSKESLRQLIDTSECQIEHPPYAQFPTVHCNAVQLTYVIDELITNAIKHYKGAAHPRIDISFAAERNGSTLYFDDNGPGIDKFFAAQVFTIYQRLNAKPDETGTGMGLPISKKIIEDEHGGVFGFETATGGGTRFYFWLPDEAKNEL